MQAWIEQLGNSLLKSIIWRTKNASYLFFYWLWRVIQQANNTTWYILNPIDFDKVLSLGGEYARNLAVIIRNPFWKDILISWADFCKEVKAEKIKSVLSSPLWFSTHLRNGNNLYANNWYSKGIKT